MLTEKIQKTDKDLVFVYTTCAGKDEAKSIAYEVIGERLAVCADYWEIDSIYPWQSVIQEVNQCMLVLTTQKILAQRLMKFIESVHSYSVPVIAECDIQVSSQAYKFWIDETLESREEFISPDEAKSREEYAEEDGYHPGKLK
jgi:periplasmic divalent cation tolerance protein